MEYPLHKRYNPIQFPLLNTTYGNEVQYVEYLPDIRLANYVAHYWELKSNGELPDNFILRMMPDSCFDFVFGLKYLGKNYFAGVNYLAALFPVSKCFHLIGVKFLPCAFTQLFGIKASELYGSFCRLDDILPEINNEMSALLREAVEKKQFIPKILDRYLLPKVSYVDWNANGRFYNDMDVLLTQYSKPGIETNKSLSFSKQHLRRLTDFYIGMSPKQFVDVVRFQKCFKAMNTVNFKQSYRNYEFLDFGYYDQAHFIRDFEKRFGLIPKDLF